jgi:hypothetical protein
MNITKRMKVKRYPEPEGRWYMVEAEIDIDRIIAFMAIKARGNSKSRTIAMGGDIVVKVRLCANQQDTGRPE